MTDRHACHHFLPPSFVWSPPCNVIAGRQPLSSASLPWLEVFSNNKIACQGRLCHDPANGTVAGINFPAPPDSLDKPDCGPQPPVSSIQVYFFYEFLPAPLGWEIKKQVPEFRN